MTLHALVVDDDPLIIALLSTFFARKGYRVDTAPDGEAALERLATGDHNLVITDRNMPRIDGLELCRRIRAMQRPAYVYCIMLTAMSEEGSLVAAMLAGVDDFLAKPLSLPELGARLRAAERVLELETGLANRNRELAQAYGQLSRDLELARTLQLGQLPPPGAFGPARFEWMLEASSYVGGDILDCFPVDEGHVCFWLADISGHGAAAAMMAFHTHQQLRDASMQVAAARLRAGGDLAEAAEAAVAATNTAFLKLEETSQYLTLAYGLLDLASGRLALVQAGHPPPLRSDAPSANYAPMAGGGVPIGILPDASLEASVCTLPRGARLVLYSDGATDCRDAAGEPFGEQRLHATLQACRGEPLARTGPAVREALRAWRGAGAFDDDVTVLALEFA